MVLGAIGRNDAGTFATEFATKPGAPAGIRTDQGRPSRPETPDNPPFLAYPWYRPARRWSIKKIAAARALCALACYLMLSGAAIPTERAFVMNGLVFVAILIDRLHISMRICALAAAFVLMVDPEGLSGVSF
jgi:hypothetical protein